MTQPVTVPEVRWDPVTRRVAIKTTLGGIRDWFVFDPRGGGHYAPGTRSPDDVEDWQPYGLPETGEES